MHPLDDAWLRFGRADKHLSEADSLIQEFGKACKDHIVANNNAQPSPSFALKNTPDLPRTLPVVVGDAIHNMRASLDYIVFELAKKDSSKIQNGTQFLIEDRKIVPGKPTYGFDGRKGKCLNGLCTKHIGMIEALQPYSGVDWTKTLRNISNPDKHRHLTVINKSGYFIFSYSGSSDLTNRPLTIDPNDWDIDATNAIYIAESDPEGPALIPTLYNIQIEVCRVLELFKGEF